MSRDGEGETRSVYVVQRHFRRVRRGYDPDEVDRHLQLVSEWFRESRAGERARKLEAQLQARERAVAEKEDRAEQLLQTSRLEADAILEGARLRARADTAAAERAAQDADSALEAQKAEIAREGRAAAAQVLA
ncbi:MAG: DivIVA domain-containing protein, partial [Solirubrobacterales bacterium]|nr:DivIVA domain-containing protein [Solirubrobacterales bacterium]